MKDLKTIDLSVEQFKSDFSEPSRWEKTPPKSKEIRKTIESSVKEILASLKSHQEEIRFGEVERQVIHVVFALGRLFLAFFLAVRQERSGSLIKRFRARRFAKRRAQPRNLKTYFGKVRYWRTYMTSSVSEGETGTYPLDIALGLTKDGFSMVVLSMAAKLATLVSYDRVTAILLDFLQWSPSKTAVEQTVYGLGSVAPAWFRECSAPAGDGDVLVIQIDSKAIPTATETELEKRRGKRQPSRYPDSPRHRGREKRRGWTQKRRKKKGDKSKNGKGATLVVMYTLERTINDEDEFYLKGPLNKKVYATFEPKRQAVLFARQEADKRGFKEDSGKDIQIVTDGDEDLARYVEDLFPEAEHTIDVIHVIEYLWKAGNCFYQEGSEELELWVKGKKDLLFSDKVAEVIEDLADSLEKVPKRGPGNKGKRERLSTVIRYLTKRVGKMNYHWLAQEDFELSSGAVEGAVRHVIGERFDCGGMRWQKEGAHALLQLRCIELNGDWERFVDFVQERFRQESEATGEVQRLLRTKPEELRKSA